MAVEVTAAQPQLQSESASNAISLDAMKADSPRNALNISPAGVGETGSMARAYRALPPTVPFKLLRAAGRREYAEVPQGTLIGPADRVRIVFSPAARGRLVVRAEGRPRPLLDRDVREGSTINLDVPSGVRELQVTFTPRAEPARAVQGVSPAQPAPLTFSIPIPLEPAR
jgi:hypothetical protein